MSPLGERQGSNDPSEYQGLEPGSSESIRFTIREIERLRERLEVDVLLFMDGWRDDYDICKDMFTDLTSVAGGFRLTTDAVDEFLHRVGW